MHQCVVYQLSGRLVIKWAHTVHNSTWIRKTDHRGRSTFSSLKHSYGTWWQQTGNNESYLQASECCV